MAKKRFKIVRQMEIFDFLPDYLGRKEALSGSGDKKIKKSKLRKNPKVQEGLDRVGEYLKDETPFEIPRKIQYTDKVFCLTGKFAFGSQAKLSGIIVRLGGSVQKNITTQTNYLIIGKKESKSWVKNSYGLKIQKAVSLKLDGREIALIKEEDLIKHFPETIYPKFRQMRFEDYLGMGLNNVDCRARVIRRREAGGVV